jgi:hypothetical protein
MLLPATHDEPLAIVVTKMIKSLKVRSTQPPTARSLVAETSPEGANEVDACAYLFRACRDLQLAYQDRRVDCLFDVDPAQLPATVCHTSALMMAAEIDDAIERAPSPLPEASVTLTVRQRGTAHVVLIADRGFCDYGRKWDPGLARIRSLAARLHSNCRVSAVADCRTIMVAFDLNAMDAHHTVEDRSTQPRRLPGHSMPGRHIQRLPATSIESRR